MTEAADERTDRPAPEDRSGSPAVGAVALWLLIQLTVLALGAARVPLWYRAPVPVERVAVAQVLAAQVIASALLFPWLMRNLATGACVILVSAPFVQFAGMLAETELARLARAWGYSAIWMSALAAWAAVLRTSRAQLTGVAVAAFLAIGVPVVRYLRYEFFPSPAAGPDALRAIDPLAGAWSQLQVGSGDVRVWALPLVVLVVSVVVMWFHWRDKLSTRTIHRAVD